MQDYEGYIGAAGVRKLKAWVRNHFPTKSSLGLSNVENKSSAAIRAELTKGNVASALSGATLGELLGR